MVADHPVVLSTRCCPEIVPGMMPMLICAATAFAAAAAAATAWLPIADDESLSPVAWLLPQRTDK